MIARVALLQKVWCKKVINSLHIANPYVWVYNLNMEYRAQIEKIRAAFLRGELTLEEAESYVQPILDEMNVKGAKVAKKFGKKYKKLTFSYVFR